MRIKIIDKAKTLCYNQFAIPNVWGCFRFDLYELERLSIPKARLRKNGKLKLNAENNNFELAAA